MPSKSSQLLIMMNSLQSGHPSCLPGSLIQITVAFLVFSVGVTEGEFSFPNSFAKGMISDVHNSFDLIQVPFRLLLTQDSIDQQLDTIQPQLNHLRRQVPLQLPVRRPQPVQSRRQKRQLNSLHPMDHRDRCWK